MAVAAQLLLVTDDGALQAAVSRTKPPGARLACITAGEWRAGCNVPARQIWIDLDAVPSLSSTDATITTCFVSAARTVPQPVSGPQQILKPAPAHVLNRLWASLLGPAWPRNTSLQLDEGWLPPWTRTLLHGDYARLRRQLVDELPTRLGYRSGALFLPDPAGARLLCAESSSANVVESAARAVEDETRAEQVRAAGCCLRFLRSEWTWDEPAREIDDVAAPSTCFAPLLHMDQVVGVLKLDRPLGTRCVLCAAEQAALWRCLGAALTLVRDYAAACSEARIDALTGLYNYRWLRDALGAELRRAERFGAPLSVLSIDVDRLKEINDSRGHAAGDAALRQIAARIVACLRQFDAAARVGGDEFLVLLPSTDQAGAQQAAQRLLMRLMEAPAAVSGGELRLSASIGVAQAARSGTALELLEAADQAMYAAKRNGGGRIITASSTQTELTSRTARDTVHYKDPALASPAPTPVRPATDIELEVLSAQPRHSAHSD